MIFNWREGALRKPLAGVMRRLALSAEQIAALKSNYADAVASGEFARAFDPENPNKPYLPPDLLDPNGTWVELGRTEGPTAPRHLSDENPFTNSVFTVHIRLPGGRAATLEFVERLQKLSAAQANADPNAYTGMLYNRNLPQFPRGTALALVRHAMLIDNARQATLSPIIETVQMRTILTDGFPSDEQMQSPSMGTARLVAIRKTAQSVQEFRLIRARLFAGKSGGLQPLTLDERDFKTGMATHREDEFERFVAGDPGFPRQAQSIPVLEGCYSCHLPGSYSFESFFAFRSEVSRPDLPLKPFPLTEMKTADVARAAITHQQRKAAWTALQQGLGQ
jgi:hypothetical protein